MRRKRRVASPDGISLEGIPQIYPNDPDAPGGLVPATPVAPGPGEPRFVIEGPRYAPAAYAPGTLAFQYWQRGVALPRADRTSAIPFGPFLLGGALTGVLIGAYAA